MSKKVLIVGGVAGGASTAARLRRLDENAQIIVFERGEYISYANCGLPYHVGDVIKERKGLILQTPEAMSAKLNVDVRTRHEVISIDRKAKTVAVKNLDTAQIYDESYDTLVLSPGSSPIRPNIPGIDGSRIMTLWTVPDTDKIKAMITESEAKSAVVIGAGFIGLEIAENLQHVGLDVTIVEKLDQVMAPLDYEMAQLLHENIEQNGINLCLNDGVSSFVNNNDSVTVELDSGKKLKADLAILAIGVRPNSELAQQAGLQTNANNGIVVDEFLRTSDPSIYAVGDAIEVENFVNKDRTMIPLAGPANKQGRITANNIAGGNEAYQGTQGSSIVKVFDLTAASTGQSEKALIKQGMIKGEHYQSITITQNSHASYYPGAVPLTLKMLFSTDGERIFGAQIVGRDGVDKRIDIITVAIRMGAKISDLKSFEFAYAPPYSSAKDPVNMAGFVAENLLVGRLTLTEWDAVEKNPEAIILDVREEAERVAYYVPNSISIPLGTLRNILDQLDKNKEIIILCAIGVRAYNAACILQENGFTNVKVYPGGTRFYQSTHYKEIEMDFVKSQPVLDDGYQETKDLPKACIRVDCSGLQCPGPLMRVFETIKDMKDGEVMEVIASDPGFTRDIGAWCRRTGNQLMLNERRGDEYAALVKKGNVSVSTSIHENPEGKTLIVFSGDLDKVLASFIIANGSAAMGRPVTMFFTFWGLNVLRKDQKQKVDKSIIESMFGFMMPRGAKKLKLSKMNMAGMGSAMMKKIMKDKNVESLEELIKKAMDSGVKIVACTMSMDVMGIKEEELIDGIELGGVGAYLGDAEESNVNLFI